MEDQVTSSLPELVLSYFIISMIGLAFVPESGKAPLGPLFAGGIVVGIFFYLTIGASGVFLALCGAWKAIFGVVL